MFAVQTSDLQPAPSCDLKRCLSALVWGLPKTRTFLGSPYKDHSMVGFIWARVYGNSHLLSRSYEMSIARMWIS